MNKSEAIPLRKNRNSAAENEIISLISNKIALEIVFGVIQHSRSYNKQINENMKQNSKFNFE